MSQIKLKKKKKKKKKIEDNKDEENVEYNPDLYMDDIENIDFDKDDTDLNKQIIQIKYIKY